MASSLGSREVRRTIFYFHWEGSSLGEMEERTGDGLFHIVPTATRGNRVMVEEGER